MSARNALHVDTASYDVLIRRDGHATVYRLYPGAVKDRPSSSPSSESRLRLVPQAARPSTSSRGRRFLIVSAMTLVYAVTYAIAWALVHGIS